MQAKLTLRLDDELIRRAKRYSSETGKSLSQLVAGYFAALTSDRAREEPEELPPLVRSLRGCLRVEGAREVDEEDYYRYLEEKHR